jgi:hypothetical protein
VRLVIGIALLALVPSCYLAHERETGVDAAASDVMRCAPGIQTTVTIDPPLPTGHIDYVRILGMDSPPATPAVVLHLDTCPMAGAPCPHDASISAMGIGFAAGVVAQVPSVGFTGFLDWDGRTLHVLFIDGRRCASCGGELEILAGDLVAPLSAAAHTGVGAVRCSTGCGEDRAVTIESHGDTVMGTSGALSATQFVVSPACTAAQRSPCCVLTTHTCSVPSAALTVTS